MVNAIALLTKPNEFIPIIWELKYNRWNDCVTCTLKYNKKSWKVQNVNMHGWIYTKKRLLSNSYLLIVSTPLPHQSMLREREKLVHNMISWLHAFWLFWGRKIGNILSVLCIVSQLVSECRGFIPCVCTTYGEFYWIILWRHVNVYNARKKTCRLWARCEHSTI